jgi:hypothetical protein
MDNDVLVIPAWCDPKRRTVRWSWHDTWVGLLCVDDDEIVYWTAGGATLAATRADSRIDWLRGGWALGNRFDLHTPDGSFRCYLSRPANTAPTLTRSVWQRIGAHLSTSGQISGLLNNPLVDLGDVVGGITAVGQGAGTLADIAVLPGQLAGLRAGARNAAALRQRLSGVRD